MGSTSGLAAEQIGVNHHEWFNPLVSLANLTVQHLIMKNATDPPHDGRAQFNQMLTAPSSLDPGCFVLGPETTDSSQPCSDSILLMILAGSNAI
jgi:hypothetical protein